MRKFTSLMLMLVMFASTAMADLTQNYYKNSNFWANTDTYPTDLVAVIDGAHASNGTAIKKDGATVQMANNPITVTENGNIVVTFTHNGGQHMLNIMGVDVIDAEGNVVAHDYHYGSAGGNHINNVYTLENLTAGAELTLRSFVYDNTGTNDRTNSAQGYYTITNATGEAISVVKPAVSLENGIYIIREVNGDVALYDGTNIARGKKVADAANENYIFYIAKGNDGYYTIQTIDGKFVTYPSTGNGTKLTTSVANEATDDNKWWAIREGSGNGLRIIVPKTNDNFNAPGWNYAINLTGAANSGLGLWDSNGGNSNWYITKAPVMSEGYAKMKIANTLAYSDGTNIVKNAASGKSMFKFTRGENGCYTIQDADNKYIIYTSTNNHLLSLVEEADANDNNKWWTITFDLTKKDNALDIFPKQENIGDGTPAFNWSQAGNSKLGFWGANDDNSYCSMEFIDTPEIGSLIAFKSAAAHEYCGGKYVMTSPTPKVYTGAGYSAERNHTQLVFGNCDPATTPSAVFEVVAGANNHEFKLKNVHTQEYVKSFENGAQHMGNEDEATAITFVKLGVGQTAVYGANNNNPMHAQEAYNVIVTWNTAAYGASAWIMEDVAAPIHKLNIGDVGYSTLQLGFNATIPTGVECYAVSAIDGTAKLAEIEGILPANTAVVVKAAKGEYAFTYTAENASAVTNKLCGSLYTTNITPAGTAYILANGDNGVGLYKAELNEGEGTAFQNNANKAYLVVEGSSEALSYGFDFGGTTAIEGVEATAGEKAIYDLTGRKIDAITAPGLYIINGVKTIVE